jgi:sulfopyruvate decarboxylase alpha subunit
LLKERHVTQVAYVPDAGHAYLLREVRRDPEIRDVVLTTEEEGVAIACGAHLGGGECVLLMQSSGVGNCVNMLSLLTACQFPFLTLVAMRGEYAEFNPWQGPMGRAVAGAFELMGVTVMRVDNPDEVEATVAAAIRSAFDANERIAVLLGQKLIGHKSWTE